MIKVTLLQNHINQGWSHWYSYILQGKFNLLPVNKAIMVLIESIKVRFSLQENVRIIAH